jgi:hypothetical protein
MTNAAGDFLAGQIPVADYVSAQLTGTTPTFTANQHHGETGRLVTGSAPAFTGLADDRPDCGWGRGRRPVR